VFDNLHAHGGFVRRTTVRNSASWACSLRDVELDEVVVEKLKARVGGPGKSVPMFLWGCLARRTVLSGRIGSLIWNPPWSTDGSVSPSVFEHARRFYEAVDWALDITEARFTSVPSLWFGPPGALIRRDPTTQPLVTRRAAVAALEASGRDSGVWAVVLDDLLRHEWPSDAVLIPAMGASKQARERDLAGLALLESVGAFDDDPLRQA
jgi:hypothetical protein